MNRAIFLDRDGVIVEDVDLLTKTEQIKLISDAPHALKKMKEANFLLIVVSNQTVVSRGLSTVQEVDDLNADIDVCLEAAGGPCIDEYYFCPHHPNATLEKYRVDCDCRKPRPGLLLRASRDNKINLSESFMIGDRITDIIAGHRAGCRTIMVRTGAYNLPPIVTSEPIDNSIKPNYVCDTLAEAGQWIMGKI